MNLDRAAHVRWGDLPLEELKGAMTRRFVTTDRQMVAQVFFKKGDEVARHSHPNEQFTYVLTGALEFWLGDDEAQHVVVAEGELIVIPADLPHRAHAIEDTFELDIFNPPRRDWLDGTDSYIR